MGKIEIIEGFTSHTEGVKRKIRIYFPDSYFLQRCRRYPVIYMMDGQNVFNDPRSAVYDTWQVNKCLERLVAQGELQREWMVVALDHLPDRLSEYSPWAFPEWKVSEPRGAVFLEALTGEIMPFIHSRFRTLRGARHTALVGSSLGGLMALYCGRERPDVIGRIGSVSPSLAWSHFRTFEHWHSHLDAGSKIYIDMGTEEKFSLDSGNFILDYGQIVKDFAHRLRKLGYGEGELKVYVEQGGVHYETDWCRRFPVLAKFLLND